MAPLSSLCLLEIGILRGKLLFILPDPYPAGFQNDKIPHNVCFGQALQCFRYLPVHFRR